MTDFSPELAAIRAAVDALEAKLNAAPPPADPALLSHLSDIDKTMALLIDTFRETIVELHTAPPVPAPTPAPADTNAYPIPMPEGITAGAAVDVGTGPDRIDFIISNAVDLTIPPSNLVLLIDGKAIFGPFVCTSWGGKDQTKSQHFQVWGSFGPTPHKLSFVTAGFKEYVMISVTFNLAPCYFNGVADSRGNISVNATQIINTNGSNTDWTTEPAATATQPAPGGTTAPPAGDTTLQAQVTATPVGGALTLSAAIYTSVAKIDHAITIRESMTVGVLIDATGLTLAGPGRGALATTVPGCVFQDFAIQGAHNADNNGAGIHAILGADFAASGITITDCDDGIRTAACNAHLFGCRLYGNGAGDSRSHNAYFSGLGAANVITVDESKFELAKMGHELKVRAGTTNVTNTDFTARDGSCINCPDGGVLNVTGGTFRKPADAIDFKVIDFGRELVKETAADQAAYVALGMVANLTNVFIDNQTGRKVILQGEGRSTLNLSNVTSNGDVETDGWLAVNGAVTRI